MGREATRRKRRVSGSGAGIQSPRISEVPISEVHRGGDPAKALAKIQEEDPKKRIEGAKELAQIRSPGSFTFILSAIEKEQNREVKLALLSALISLSNLGEFKKPDDTTERLEKMLFAETDFDVILQINMALYHFGPSTDKLSAHKYFNELAERVEEKFGVDHVVSRGVRNMVSYGISTDLF